MYSGGWNFSSSASISAASTESGLLSPFDAEGVWWLVHTKPRNEKALGVDLRRLGIAHFLPLSRVQRRYGGQRSFSRLPLFPGYLFLRGDDENRYAVLATQRAVGVIRVVDQELLHQELISLERVTASDELLDLYPGIRKGRLCRIVHGVLEGVEGMVLRRRGTCLVYLSVSLLGQSAEVEIDPALLEVID